MKKFVVAPALAALVMFIWGFLYWGVLNVPYQALGQVPDESATALALGQLFPKSGAYLLPSPAVGEAKAAELMKRGPIAQVFIVKESMQPMEPAVMVKGFVHMLVVALVLAAVLSGLTKSLETWGRRVMFCAGVGLLVAICDLGEAIWWHHPWGWTLGTAVYDFLMFTIAGLVLAKFVTPTPAAKAS